MATGRRRSRFRRPPRAQGHQIRKPIVKRIQPPITDPAFEKFLAWELETLFPATKIQEIFDRIGKEDRISLTCIFIAISTSFMEAFIELLERTFPNQIGRRALVEKIIRAHINKITEIGFPESAPKTTAP